MKKLEGIKAIAFDLDSTLVDFVYMKKKTALAAAKAMIHEGLKTTVQKLYKQIFTIYGKENWEYQKTFRDVLLKYYPSLSPNEFEHYQQAAILAYLEEKPKSFRVYPNVIPTLRKLKKKYKLALVTDAPRNKAWQRLIMAKLTTFFDPIITFTDTNHRKPSPKPFKLLLKELNLKPHEVLFVGDNPERDIRGAKAVGINVLLVNNNGVNLQKIFAILDNKKV